jgi:hypothetical protein
MLVPIVSKRDREPQLKALFQKACDGAVAESCMGIVHYCKSVTATERQKFWPRACELKRPEGCREAAYHFLSERDPTQKVDLGSALELFRMAADAAPSDPQYKNLLEDFLRSPTDFVIRAHGFYCGASWRKRGLEATIMVSSISP